jgi:hypothetical protein
MLLVTSSSLLSHKVVAYHRHRSSKAKTIFRSWVYLSLVAGAYHLLLYMANVTLIQVDLHSETQRLVANFTGRKKRASRANRVKVDLVLWYLVCVTHVFK